MPECLSWQTWETKERKPKNYSRIRSDGPTPASQQWLPRGQGERLGEEFHTYGQVQHQGGWRVKLICTSAPLSSSPLTPAEPILSALLPLLQPGSILIFLPHSSSYPVQLQVVTQKDDTSKKCPDASAISILPGIRWISESAGRALSGLLQPASRLSKTPT